MSDNEITDSIFIYRRKADKRNGYILIVIFIVVAVLFYLSVSEHPILGSFGHTIRGIFYVGSRLVAVVFLYFPFMIFRYIFRPRKIVLKKKLIQFPKVKWNDLQEKKIGYSRIVFIKKIISNKIIIKTRQDKIVLQSIKFDSDSEEERFIYEVKQKIQR